MRAVITIDGKPARLGLADVPSTRFTANADYNLGYALVRVLAFSIGEPDRDALHDEGQTLADATRGVGSDFVAEVVAVGADVTGLRPGQRVVPCADWPSTVATSTADGRVTANAAREFLRLPADRLMAVPDAMPDEVAAALSTAGQTAFAMVRRLAVQGGEQALVFAAHTSTGWATAVALVDRGARVTALAPAQHAHALRAVGISDVFTADPDGWAAVGRQARLIRGFDIVVDPRQSTSLANAIRLLGFDGRYITCADSAGGAPAHTGLETTRDGLTRRNAVLMGQHLGTRADLAAAIQRWMAGAWRPVIDVVFSADRLDEFASKAFDDPDRLGSVVLSFGLDPRGDEHRVTTGFRSDVAAELRRRVEHDQTVRAEGRPDRIAASDRSNVQWLRQVIRRHGWPGLSLVGDQGGKDAWLMALHADRQTLFQRQALELLIEAVDQGEAPAWQVAYLIDRVLMHRGHPQRYGTQFQRTPNGWEPLAVEDPDGIDDRRMSLGLPRAADAGVRELPPRLRNGM